MESQMTRAISEKPEIGFAGAGGGRVGTGCGAVVAAAGVTGADAVDTGVGWGAAGAAAWSRASSFFKQSANCFMSADAVAWIIPTPRPYCATAPESVRLVCTSTFEPLAAGSSLKDAVALAPPRPLASVPCAFTRA